MLDWHTNSQKKSAWFFSGPEAVVLRAWLPPVSCQKLNPVSLIHDHVSCPLCLSTDTLNTEFWESDSELHIMVSPSMCTYPMGSMSLRALNEYLCLGILVWYFWDMEFALSDSLGRETWTWPSACFLWPLAFAVVCSPFLRPVFFSVSGRTLWLFPSFALWFYRDSDLIVICTGHWYAGNGISEKTCSWCFWCFFHFLFQVSNLTPFLFT